MGLCSTFAYSNLLLAFPFFSPSYLVSFPTFFLDFFFILRLWFLFLLLSVSFGTNNKKTRRQEDKKKKKTKRRSWNKKPPQKKANEDPERQRWSGLGKTKISFLSFLVQLHVRGAYFAGVLLKGGCTSFFFWFLVFRHVHSLSFYILCSSAKKYQRKSLGKNAAAASNPWLLLLLISIETTISSFFCFL